MGIVKPFSTITEMFVGVTDTFANEKRPMYRYKKDGTYHDLSFARMREWVEHFVGGLAELGLVKSDRLAIISENRPEWVIADIGTLFLGAVDVPIYPTLTAKQEEYILNDSGTKIAVVSNQYQLNKLMKVRDGIKSLEHIIVMSNLDSAGGKNVYTMETVCEMGKKYLQKHPDISKTSLSNITPDDLLTIIYTSGTTGNPKGVMLTHNNLVSNIVSTVSTIKIDSTDILLSFLPLCHSFERMAGYYTAMACGCTVAYAESIDTVRDNLLEIRPTIVTTVPRLFERIYSRIKIQVESSSPARQKIFNWAIETGRKHAELRKQGRGGLVLKGQHALADKLVFSKLKDRTGGRIRFFVSGGAALARELGEFFEAVGITIIEGYGLTETSPVISANRLDDYKFGTVGRPIPGVEIKIAEDGEILARGPNIMVGYYNNKKATEETIDKDGWLHTGDIGIFDPAGHLVITDRKKHLFVSSGGKNIAPQPLENLFLQSKYIDQFVLIGDKRMFLSALIVPDYDALKEYADSHRLPYKTKEDITRIPEVHKLIDEDIRRLQKDLANYERVRRFAILDKPLSIEDGEITPTMKVRRKVVEERYRDLIEGMYQGVN
jgi:long-chain acyl-CoA synthetase